MLIIDDDEGRALTAVTLLLTPDEARELADAARDLADHPEKHHHHVNDSDYLNEITVMADTPRTREDLGSLNGGGGGA